MQRWRARKRLKLLVAASANSQGIFGTVSGAEIHPPHVARRPRAELGCATWERPVLSTGAPFPTERRGAPLPTAQRDQGDLALNRPQINPPRVDRDCL